MWLVRLALRTELGVVKCRHWEVGEWYGPLGFCVTLQFGSVISSTSKGDREWDIKQIQHVGRGAAPYTLLAPYMLPTLGERSWCPLHCKVTAGNAMALWGLQGLLGTAWCQGLLELERFSSGNCGQLACLWNWSTEFGSYHNSLIPLLSSLLFPLWMP